MLTLTNAWGMFDNVPLNGKVRVTKRLFLQKLEDPSKRDSSLYLAMNTLSGSIDIFTSEEGEMLENLINGDGNNISPEFLEQLKNRGYVYPSDEIEQLMYKMVIKHHKDLIAVNDKILPFFALDTTCSVGCDYCFQKRGLEDSTEDDIKLEKSFMDEESLRSAFKALDFIQDLHSKQSKWAVGFGGEPLKGKLAEINKLFIQLARERNLPIVYFSNLALLNDRLFEVLKENAQYIHFIETTIDGVAEKHNKLRKLPNAFERAVGNIDRLLKAGVPITIRTNVGPSTINNIPELAQFYEDKGWFELPNFKSIISKITDRHHDGTNIYKEDEAMSEWLKIKDENPIVGKMQDYNIAYGLYNLVLATELRNVIDKVDFRIDTSPVIRHCPTDSGAEFVFTGKPGNAIYTCAECSGMTDFQIGTHSPYLNINSEKAGKWGNDGYIDLLRTIDTLDGCNECIAATQCGGDCSLEAINEYGSAENVYCKDIPGAIKGFMEKESGRLYKRCKSLMDQHVS